MSQGTDAGFVYFAYCQPGYLKIGFTTRSPQGRICHIRNGRSLAPQDARLGTIRLVGFKAGRMADEVQWHHKLAHLLAVIPQKNGHTEWFVADRKLMRRIERLQLRHDYIAY
jgi:hypothetical protein